ncbi:MAG: helix-hairpin-helix domain-containing protein [Microgenomates group bacterium]
MGEQTALPPSESQHFFHVYRVPFIFLIASTVCIVASVILFTKTLQTNEQIQFSSDKYEISSSESAKIAIDIRGAVLRPGVYYVSNGSRIADVISLAGGVSDAVDIDLADKILNYASYVSDGMKIYVPKEENMLSGQSQSLTSAEAIVSVNTDSSTLLESLPGIGEITAKKIIDNRPYTSLEELVTKHVFSASLLEKLRSQLSL